MRPSLVVHWCVLTAALLSGPFAPVAAQNASTTAVARPAPPSETRAPDDYLIGPDDVLSIVFWRDKELSIDVVVRPDGRVSLPLLNDVVAAGRTPDQLREALVAGARRFLEEPRVSVVVKQINSRKVFIMGHVEKPGSYPLTGPTTVLQLIAMAGGLGEFAASKRIIVMRTEADRQVSYRFNYRDIVDRKNLNQNIELKPGDTVLVP
jgi:polysaccharide export outer membrane protein